MIGFALESREAVDARYAELTAAGYTGRQPPFDAFWVCQAEALRECTGAARARFACY